MRWWSNWAIEQLLHHLKSNQSNWAIAPSSQIPGLNLTQFNNIGTFRPNMAQHIPKPPPGHAGLETSSIDPLRSIELFATYFSNKASSLTPDMNWVMSFLHLHTPQKVWISVVTCSHVSGLIATAFHNPHMTLITDQSTANKGVKINLHSSSLIKNKCQVHSPINTNPLQVFLHLSWWRPLVWGWN